jgi:hypothetical protein
LTDYIFAEATSTTDMSGGGFDGILGFGWNSIAVGNYPTFISALIQNGIVSKAVFSFYLGNNSPGELILGGNDPSHFTGSPVEISLESETYWQVGLNSVSIGTIPIVKSSGPAILDTGTTLLVGPVAQVEMILEAIGGKNTGGLVHVACSAATNAPVLSFNIGGHSFSLTGKDYIINDGNDGCIVGIQGADMKTSKGLMWILGDVFLRSWYVQFDLGNKSVWLAPST